MAELSSEEFFLNKTENEVYKTLYTTEFNSIEKIKEKIKQTEGDYESNLQEFYKLLNEAGKLASKGDITLDDLSAALGMFIRSKKISASSAISYLKEKQSSHRSEKVKQGIEKKELNNARRILTYTARLINKRTITEKELEDGIKKIDEEIASLREQIDFYNEEINAIKANSIFRQSVESQQSLSAIDESNASIINTINGARNTVKDKLKELEKDRRYLDTNGFLLLEEGLKKSLENTVNTFSSEKKLISNIEKAYDEIVLSFTNTMKYGKDLGYGGFDTAIEELEEFKKYDERLLEARKKVVVAYAVNIFEQGGKNVKVKISPRGHFEISNRYSTEQNKRTINQLEKQFNDMLSDITKQLNKTVRQYGNLEVKTKKRVSANKLVKNFKQKDVVHPKAILAFFTDQKNQELAYYQALTAVKLTGIKKNRDYRNCLLAATYFQSLVSNTPIDEPYSYKVTRERASVEKDTSFELTPEGINSVYDKTGVETYEVVRHHYPDTDCARGDWVLHFKGATFKAFSTLNGKGDFDETLFEEKNNPSSIRKIADYLFEKTKDLVGPPSFFVDNDNEHIKYLEYGGYKHDSEAKVGSKYGLKHGVTKEHVYQAPYGMLRLVNATWEKLAAQGKGTDKSILRKGNFNIDVSSIDIEAVQKLLRKAGMPKLEDVDSVFTKNIY